MFLFNSLRPSDTYICVSELTIIGSDNGLSPDRRQAIIWTNAGILIIGPLRTNFSEILIEILAFSYKKMRLKVSSAKWRPFHLGLNVLRKCFWEVMDTLVQSTSSLNVLTLRPEQNGDHFIENICKMFLFWIIFLWSVFQRV